MWNLGTKKPGSCDPGSIRRRLNALEAVADAEGTDDFDVVGVIGQDLVVELTVVGYAQGDDVIGHGCGERVLVKSVFTFLGVQVAGEGAQAEGQAFIQFDVMADRNFGIYVFFDAAIESVVDAEGGSQRNIAQAEAQRNFAIRIEVARRIGVLGVADGDIDFFDRKRTGSITSKCKSLSIQS